MGALEVGLPDAFVKVDAFLLEAVEHPVGQYDSLACHVKRKVEKQRQVGLQLPLDPLFKLQELVSVQPSPTALISICRVTEAVADDPLASLESRHDEARDVLATSGKHQQRLGFEVHGSTQEQFAQFFAEFGATRLSRHMDNVPSVAQVSGQPLDMAALASTIDAFEGNEFAFHLPPLWYLLTARLCSSRVCENWLLPSPRATKYSAELSPGLSAASNAAGPGMAMGEGGSPARV